MECSLKNIVSYRIAGHTFMIKGGDSVRCVEKIPGFDVFACETTPNEQPFVINLDEDLDFIIENPVYEVSNDGYDSFFGVRDGVFVFEVRNKEKQNFHFCMEYRDNEIFASSANDEEALRISNPNTDESKKTGPSQNELTLYDRLALTSDGTLERDSEGRFVQNISAWTTTKTYPSNLNLRFLIWTVELRNCRQTIQPGHTKVIQL